ncbi:hypothetical protein [Paenibacillus apis]|uniref:Uncharacterized protein n=1 Tax=Paenibacillus apis TaxID=1792174 RepID=A0A919Y5W9_9BACL|nr:hypothetical protein [Paenibacillus apis]GIO44929.1 hypothetical protein J41TS4_46870 [Paenibacillus apis]
MNEWRPDWNRRLARPPFKQRRFRNDLMERVENKLRVAEEKRDRKAWITAALTVTPILLLAAGGGIWFAQVEPSLPVPVQGVQDAGGESGEAFRSSFKRRAGGDFEWWNSAENAAKQDSDRTIVTFVKALMQRELGVLGGPTPDIWNNPEVKQPLERYDVSSPWVYEVYVDTTIPVEEKNKETTIYRLRLLLRDSVPLTYQEMIDVHVRSDNHKIGHIEQVETDEAGMSLEAYARENQGKEVLLKEEPALDLKITGSLRPNASMIYPIRVRYGGAERTFDDWDNVDNESYYPQVSMLQTGDGEEEVLAVILTRGYGTGVYESTVKLLRRDLTVVSAADPVLVASSKLTSTVTAEEGKRTFQYTLGGETRTFEYNEDDAGLWLDQPGLGSIIRYFFEGNTLYASVPVQVSPAEFPVTIRLKYKYDGAVFVVEDATFEDDLH